MKTCLLALNSKFIHTNLAIRSLREYASQRGVSGIEIAEYTINHRLPFIVDEVYRKKPDVLFLSCYIWNIEMMLDFASEYKKRAPGTPIIAGGPEVSFDSRQQLEQHPELDLILYGEGEQTFTALMQSSYFGGAFPYQSVPSLCFRDGVKIIQTPPAEPVPMEELPFPYPDLSQLDNKILYFETIRGCPFRCSYCLSSVAGKVRYLPLELALPRLQRFLDAKVKQVKFVDRTFNCSKSHAMAIWHYLAEHDNGITNFHFELTAHLIDPEMIAFLKTVRKGLFQFEIGVQSTNPETIQEIRRTTNTEKLLEICRELDSTKNIHLHLDLIAGLPYEGLDSFGRSFDQVMAIRPQQMQMGFLKVLKGSHMAQSAEQYRLVYSSKAPYQIITTNWLDYDEMLLLKDMEEVVETYYNSGLFAAELELVFQQEPSLFRFFLEFGQFYTQQGYHLIPQSPENRHTILKDFFLTRKQEHTGSLPLLHDLCLYDLCLHEKPRKLPDWISLDANQPYRDMFRTFFERDDLLSFLPEYAGEDPKRIAKLVHLQLFHHNPVTLCPGKTALLFRYRERDLLGNALVTPIPLELLP